MDPLTHSFAGAALARTSLGRASRFAPVALIVGANLPDVDVLSFVAGSDAALGFRRGWTHGPLGALLLPVLLAGVLAAVAAWKPRPDRPSHSFWRLLGLSLLGSATHPLLDWLNTYGVRWLMPFDDRWYYGDAVFIVDPWLWLILGGAVFASRQRGFSPTWLLLAGLTSLVVLGASNMVPVGARVAWIAGIVAVVLLRRTAALRAWPERVAAAGLLLASAYIGVAVASSTAAAHFVREELARRGVADVGRLMVGPRPADPFRWDVVAETPQAYRVGALRLLPRPTLDLAASAIPKLVPSDGIDAALAAPHVQGALRWMRFPFARVEPTGEGTTVYLLDARYVRRPSRGFGAAVVELDRELRVLPPRPNAEPPADLVLRNGAVYTLDAARSWASAVAVRGDRIVFVGDSAGAAPFVGPSTEVVELEGRMVLPGFHDSHVHPVTGGVELDLCQLGGARSLEEALATVRRCAADHPDRAWIEGSGYELPLFAGGIARKERLDEVTGSRPAYLTSADGHSAWVNSAALEIARVSAGTPDPPNGRIERDAASGEPLGTLRESAMDLVSRHVPRASLADRILGLERALEMAHRFGITSWVEASASVEIADAYLALSERGRLTARTLLSLQLGAAAEAVPLETLIRYRERYRGPNLRSDAVKIFVDGVIEGRTAALLEPYLGLSGREGFRGELNYAPEELARHVVALDRAGFELHLHAIGDRAIRISLDALAAARRENGERDRRPQLAHIQLFDPTDIPRFRQLGAIADFQPLWSYADSYMNDLTEPVLGAERARWQYPMRSMIESGAVVAAGSDWSVTSMNPLEAIEVALTHRPPGDPGPPWNGAERVGLPEILASYTIHGAYLMRREALTGSIEVGKAADLVVLDCNLFEVEPHRIHEVRVLRTLLAGRTVWPSGAD